MMTAVRPLAGRRNFRRHARRVRRLAWPAAAHFL